MIAAVGILPSISRIWIIAGLMLFSAGLPASAQDKPFSKWFRYGAEVDAAWQVAGDFTNPLQLSIRRKGTKEGTPVKRVMVLYPRASSAYDTEITRILRVFDDKEVDAEFTVINFELVDSAGKAALQLAEARKFKSLVPIEYQSRGMALTASRVEMINKSHIASILISIEDLLAADGSPAGTRVTICFPLEDIIKPKSIHHDQGNNYRRRTQELSAGIAKG